MDYSAILVALINAVAIVWGGWLLYKTKTSMTEMATAVVVVTKTVDVVSEDMHKVKVATDGMKDALVKATYDAAFAEGKVEGLDKGKVIGRDSAEAEAVKLAEGVVEGRRQASAESSPESSPESPTEQSVNGNPKFINPKAVEVTLQGGVKIAAKVDESEGDVKEKVDKMADVKQEVAAFDRKPKIVDAKAKTPNRNKKSKQKTKTVNVKTKPAKNRRK